MAGKKKINIADLIFKIGDDGTLKIFEGQTKKAGKAVDKLGKSERTLNRNFKGASRQSSNQTKNFSKMAQGITGGLVPAYATLAANIFAIGAAFRFLQSAADLRILESGQLEYAQRTGQSLSILTRQLQAATDGQLAFADAAQSVAIATAAGLSSKQINELGQVAKNASLMLGRDLTDSFNRLIRGAVKAEPELLDELGIILRLETAAENYAQKLDLNAKQLNIFQKSQSVVNEVLAQGLEKFGGVETATNGLTKLAKSFDDLVNSIKRAIGPIAEFMAATLSKNTVATAGMGIMAGTSLIRALTPQVPNVDVAAAGDSMRAQAQGGIINDAGMAKFGKLETKRDIDNFSRSLNAKKSKFINYTTFSKAEHSRMIFTLRAQQTQLQASSAGVFGSMFANWKTTLLLMQAEHGATMGKIKFAQMMLMKGLAALGYVGLAVSAIAMLVQLFDKSTEAEKAYKDAQIAFGNLYESNAKDLEKTIGSLKVHDSLMTNMLQTARALNNIDFGNIMSGLDGGPGGGTGVIAAFRAGNFVPFRDDSNEYLSKGQMKGLQGTIRLLEAEKKVLIGGSDAYKEHNKIIALVRKTIDDNKDGVLSSTDSFANMSDEFTRIGTTGTIAQNTMKGLGQTTQILTSSTGDFEKALRSFRTPQTQLTRLTSNIKQAGGALKGLGEQFALGQVDVGFNKDTGTIFDTATTTMIDTFLPKSILPGNIREKMAEAQEEISGFTKSIESGLFSEGQVDEYTLKRANAAGNIVKLVGEATIAEAERLHEIEMGFIQDKTKVQKNLILVGMGATKGQTKQLKMQGAMLTNSIAQTNQQILLDELEAKGLTKDDAQVTLETEKLALMTAQGMQLQLQLDKAHQLSMAMKNSFETGIAGSIDDLITGKNSSLSEAMANLAKGVFESFSKTIADQMATGISNFLFGNRELEGYKKGAEILKQGIIDGANEAMGNKSGDISSESDMDGGKFAKYAMKAASFFTGAKGGITPVYAATGGVFSGSKGGYPATLHGNEAVVPLPDGKSIPISGNLGGTVNVAVNMTTGESSSTTDSSDMIAMGESIAQAVQNEIEKQQRPGGQLSPY